MKTTGELQNERYINKHMASYQNISCQNENKTEWKVSVFLNFIGTLVEHSFA